MGTSELNAEGNSVMDEHPIQGEIENQILLAASYYRNQDKLWPDEPLQGSKNIWISPCPLGK